MFRVIETSDDAPSTKTSADVSGAVGLSMMAFATSATRLDPSTSMPSAWSDGCTPNPVTRTWWGPETVSSAPAEESSTTASWLSALLPLSATKEIGASGVPERLIVTAPW